MRLYLASRIAKTVSTMPCELTPACSKFLNSWDAYAVLNLAEAIIETKPPSSRKWPSCIASCRFGNHH
ncbi:hypothetical protein AVEN_107934-1 [Araneus ventricosus]|uniref:Uncharacterized protein n=1 Tax=Araneus ventricosus TaxID=182803 RepID=A0A4Y2IX74_ARAVE|nr:hypothetical protein AVEN_107934-1 [Araneus ventricosus]